MQSSRASHPDIKVSENHQGASILPMRSTQTRPQRSHSPAMRWPAGPKKSLLTEYPHSIYPQNVNLTHIPICLGFPKSCLPDINLGSLLSWKPPVTGLQDHQLTLSRLVHVTSQSTCPPHLQTPSTLFSPTPDPSHITLHVARREHLAVHSGPSRPQLPKESPHSYFEGLSIWTFSSISGTQNSMHISGTELLPVLFCTLY